MTTKNITNSINYNYEINTYFIATKTYHSIASEVLNGDLVTLYNSDIRKHLSFYFVEKDVYLDEASAKEKYGATVYGPEHPALFRLTNEEGKTFFTEPFRRENRFIIEKGTRFFDFFFAVTLNYYFRNPENDQFENFLKYQLNNNFNNNTEDFRKYTYSVLRKYSLTIFYRKHEIIKEEFENKFPPVVLNDDNKIICNTSFIQFRKFFSLLIINTTEGIEENSIEPFIRNNFKLKGKEKSSIKLKQDFKIICKRGYYTHVVAFFWLLLYDFKIIPQSEVGKVKILLINKFNIKADAIKNIFGRKNFREKFLNTIPFLKIKIEINSLLS